MAARVSSSRIKHERSLPAFYQKEQNLSVPVSFESQIKSQPRLRGGVFVSSIDVVGYM